MAAGENIELAGLQFEDYRTSDARFLARSGPNLFGKKPDHWLRFCERYVTLKRILRGHGLCGPVRDDLAIVETPGEFVETQAIATEVAFERR